VLLAYQQNLEAAKRWPEKDDPAIQGRHALELPQRRDLGPTRTNRPFRAQLLLSTSPTHGYARTWSHPSWENYSLLVPSNILIRCEIERAPNFSMI
jgi:hypothetical protein